MTWNAAGTSAVPQVDPALRTFDKTLLQESAYFPFLLAASTEWPLGMHS